MGFSRQEYWSGLPFPSPGDLLDPGLEPVSPALAGGSFTTVSPGNSLNHYTMTFIVVHVEVVILKCFKTHLCVVLRYVSVVFEWRGSQNLLKIYSVFLTSVRIQQHLNLAMTYG